MIEGSPSSEHSGRDLIMAFCEAVDLTEILTEFLGLNTAGGAVVKYLSAGDSVSI